MGDGFIMEKFSAQASVKRPGKLEQLKPGQELEGGKNNAKNSSHLEAGELRYSTLNTIYKRR